MSAVPMSLFEQLSAIVCTMTRALSTSLLLYHSHYQYVLCTFAFFFVATHIYVMAQNIIAMMIMTITINTLTKYLSFGSRPLVDDGV